MSTEFRIETWRKWYPFDSLPTDDEWKSVHHLAPVKAVQVIKRQRIVDSGNKEDGKIVRHPSQDEVKSVSVYKSSIDHQRQINISRNATLLAERTMYNATNTTSRNNATQSNGSARGNIRKSRSNKKKRK